MTGLRWEEPPEAYKSTQRSKVHQSIAAELKAQPGRWAVLEIVSIGLAAQIRRGDIAAYRPGGSFEARARVIDGERRIYARYVGPT